MDRSRRLPVAAGLASLAAVAALVAGCAPASGPPTASSSGTAATSGSSATPVGNAAASDPLAALRIATPWVLDAEFPEVSEQILDGVLAEAGVRSAEVRHVSGPDGESAFLLAADAGLAADTDLETWARRLSTSSLTGGAVETLRDREVALLQTDEVSIVAWLEPPLLMAVYAADAETARRIAEAVLQAP